MNRHEIHIFKGINPGAFARPAWKNLVRSLRSDRRLMQRPDPLRNRAGLATVIARHAEGGQVAILESGRDCDGASWVGVAHYLPASTMACLTFMDSRMVSAEGLMRFEFERPSVARETTPTHRDLAAEAFEDGHPHCLHG